jgi:hypothetical protein
MGANVFTTTAAKGTSYQLPTNNNTPVEVLAEDAASVLGTAFPLTDVRYTDGGTLTPLLDQTGAIAAPYGTIAQGLADPAAQVLYVTPGSYAGEGAQTITKSTVLSALGLPNVNGASLGALTIGNSMIVGVENFSIASVTAGTGGSNRFDDCVIQGALTAGAPGVVLLVNTTVVGLLTCNQLGASGGGTIVGGISCSGTIITFSDYHFAGGINITFTGAAGTVQFDLESYRRFLVAGGTVTNGSILSGDFLPPAANVAALATAPYAHIPNGQSVYVLSRFRNYVSVPLGNGDEAGTGNEWKSDPSTSSPGQRTIATWFISNAGSDDNSGAVIGSPLATGRECHLAAVGHHHIFDESRRRLFGVGAGKQYGRGRYRRHSNNSAVDHCRNLCGPELGHQRVGTADAGRRRRLYPIRQSTLASNLGRVCRCRYPRCTAEPTRCWQWHSRDQFVPEPPDAGKQLCRQRGSARTGRRCRRRAVARHR